MRYMLSFLKEPNPGNCWTFRRDAYWYFDVEYKSCQLFSSCGSPGTYGKYNFFWDEEECNRVCASVYRVRNKDWGESNIMSNDAGGRKFAFNIHKANCKPYIKHAGYPTPLLFNTWYECRDSCFEKDKEEE
ncbi:hypothetical protein RF11_08865 [Thelohanellus kitauei]|uniref:BPTI/Kunitz inhibitor domain-containing protein n=1 Tax=Thelohanellus kitauei TaxID=669202 RepID=A0A0C2JVX4_THEKT|nr:hypothetical protein RF11_08865 [Thelohanellus kitauei]